MSQDMEQTHGKETLILIAEDSPTQAAGLVHLLTSNGYEVAHAENGRQALEAIKARPPHLVISDIMMPEMDGYALCKQIKSLDLTDNIPVMLVTELSDPENVIRGLECGADNFIQKPYSEKYLMQRIQYLLSNRELRRTNRLHLGIEIDLRGKRHFITAERQQILDLLISMYDEAARLKEGLENSIQSLEVLYRLAEGLNRCTSETETLETALDGICQLPGVSAAWIFLLEKDRTFRLGGARGVPPDVCLEEDKDGECECKRKLLSGELAQSVDVIECERFKHANGGSAGLDAHASVPITGSREQFGVLNLAGQYDALATHDLLQFLHGVGSQLGLALERVRVQEHLEQLLEERTAAMKEFESQFYQAQKMEAVGRLAGGIAHDFNNILGVIKGYCGLLLNDLPEDAAIRRDIEEIESCVDRSAALTRQLLAFSRKQILCPEVVDINTLISGIESMLGRVLGEDIDLRLALAPSLGAVEVDSSQVEQVLMNLAVNARDAMPEGGILTIETANVDLSEEYTRKHVGASPGPHVMLAVSDTGIGMTAEVRDKAFEPFFTTKESGKGTGLGLSTVYGIVKQSKGCIYLYSEVGEGSTVKIYLPQVAASPAERQASSPPLELRGGETVLVVEDEVTLRDLLSRILDVAGYTALVAESGAHALELARTYEGEIDLLVTDVVMPQKGGRALAGELLAERPQMKVLFMSGYSDNFIVHKGALGADAQFIQKPFGVEELLAKVRETLTLPASS